MHVPRCGRGFHDETGSGGGGPAADGDRVVDRVGTRKSRRERQAALVARPVRAVGRGGIAEPAEPQVRHVQRLDGTVATAAARGQRVLAH